MKHKWNVTETVDTCTLCTLVRRTVAYLKGRAIVGSHPAHEYFLGNQWVRPGKNRVGASCPGVITDYSQNQIHEKDNPPVVYDTNA